MILNPETVADDVDDIEVEDISSQQCLTSEVIVCPEAVSDDVIKATLKWIGSGKSLIKLNMFCNKM